MKLIYIASALYTAGMLFVFTGALFRLQSWPYSQPILVTGLLVEATAIVLTIVWAVKKSKTPKP